MGAKIKSIEYYLPKNIYANSDLEADFPGWAANKIEEKVGIRERHIASDCETALDLAFEASEKVLNNFDRNQIDFVLFCTQSPDYFLPTSACILQDKLKLRTNIGALDYNLGCSGFIYGLALAKSLILAGISKNVLLITAETYSKHLHPNDKANRSIFGDGAASCIITHSVGEKIFDFILGTDGKGKDNLIIKNGGLRNKINSTLQPVINETKGFISDNHLYMNGPEIFNFTIESVPTLVASTLIQNHLTIDEIDYFIFHQANKYMLEYLRKKIKIPTEKFYNNMLLTGNTVSATIPIAIKNCIDERKIKDGSKLLLAGFGVGYSWGATIIEI
jgi:3-oxoacyl-[acyl-carrier-protein] synthase-3